MTDILAFPGTVRIRLTRPQAAWVDWALTGPISEWDTPANLAWDHDCTLEAAERALGDRDSCRLDGAELVLSGPIDPDGEFLSALLNMLEDVAPDLSDGFGGDEFRATYDHKTANLIAASKAACAVNAARRIREALGA